MILQPFQAFLLFDEDEQGLAVPTVPVGKPAAGKRYPARVLMHLQRQQEQRQRRRTLLKEVRRLRREEELRRTIQLFELDQLNLLRTKATWGILLAEV